MYKKETYVYIESNVHKLKDWCRNYYCPTQLNNNNHDVTCHAYHPLHYSTATRTGTETNAPSSIPLEVS